MNTHAIAPFECHSDRGARWLALFRGEGWTIAGIAKVEGRSEDEVRAAIDGEARKRNQVVALRDRMARAGFGAHLPPLRRRGVLASQARRLFATGLDAEQFGEILALAQASGEPNELLWRWLGGPTPCWRAVLDEHQRRADR